jgi:Putative adhesin
MTTISSYSKRPLPWLSLFPFLLLSLLLFLSSCNADSSSSSNDTNSMTHTNATVTTGDTTFIPVDQKPDISIKVSDVALLTLTGSDTQQAISTSQMSMPYQKQGNQVSIDFGQVVLHQLEIKIPHEANITIIVTNGNIVMNSLQGQLSISLKSGTIHVNKLTPVSSNAIQNTNGTIDVTLTQNIACSIQAQTSFGAIISGYSNLKEQRSGMQDKTSGNIGNDTGNTSINLVTQTGSISVKPA